MYPTFPIHANIYADSPSAPLIPTERETAPDGPGIPAVNIHNGFHTPQVPFAVVDAIIPDPSTGSLYGSTVPMQDTPHIYASQIDAPYCPPIVTLGSLIGDIAGGQR